jgi:hypothetical protein
VCGGYALICIVGSAFRSEYFLLDDFFFIFISGFLTIHCFLILLCIVFYHRGHSVLPICIMILADNCSELFHSGTVQKNIVVSQSDMLWARTGTCRYAGYYYVCTECMHYLKAFRDRDNACRCLKDQHPGSSTSSTNKSAPHPDHCPRNLRLVTDAHQRPSRNAEVVNILKGCSASDTSSQQGLSTHDLVLGKVDNCPAC